jgi:DNA-binding NarL/FixJ family response regulator
VEGFGPLYVRGRLPLDRPRILVADDHDAMLDTVLSLLQPDFDIVGTVNNGRDLIREAQRLQPDVIVLDIAMPILNGIEAARNIREAGLTPRLVFLTLHEQSSFVTACFDEGALGYVTKSRLRTDLIPAIRDAISGHHFISPFLPRGRRQVDRG